MTVSRRDFLKASSLVAAWTALAACSPVSQGKPNPTQTGIPLTSKPDPAQTIAPTSTQVPESERLLIHTLRRMTFGPTLDMIERARRMGLDAFIEEQLAPASIPDPEIDPLLQPLATLNMTVAQRLQLDRKSFSEIDLINATILRQRHSQRQLHEMMVEFWGNHFCIYIGKNLCQVLKTDDDRDVIRPNALGKFRDLLYASTKSPAMLVYLDQSESLGESPNENYARELLELHTVGVDSGYSHHDVAELARVLTGWTISKPSNHKMEPGLYFFNPDIHDSGEKHVMDMIIQPGGEDEGLLILDMLASHASTAHFIGKKLARRFVSDSPDPALVDELARVFLESDGDIRQILRALLSSESFKTSAGQKFKKPLDFFISALRVTGATIGGNPRKLLEYLRVLGQLPFSWQTPDGYPDTGEYWATTSGMLDRWNFGLLLASNLIKGATVDLSPLVKDAASAEDIVDLLSLRFLGERLPDDARSILVDVASSGNVDNVLPSVAGLILGSPHFQVR